jgi:hypothetical protein
VQDVGVSGGLIDAVYRDLAVSAPGRGRDVQDLARPTARVSATSCMSRSADTALFRDLVSIMASAVDDGGRPWPRPHVKARYADRTGQPRPILVHDPVGART